MILAHVNYWVLPVEVLDANYACPNNLPLGGIDECQPGLKAAGLGPCNINNNAVENRLYLPCDGPDAGCW